MIELQLRKHGATLKFTFNPDLQILSTLFVILNYLSSLITEATSIKTAPIAAPIGAEIKHFILTPFYY